MPKKSEKKTEPLMTRFDYDTNPNVPQKNPQAVMIKQIPPMDYDDMGPKVIDMPPPKLDYDSPLPMPAPMPLPPPPPPAMPPVMDKGPMNLPLAPQPPVPMQPGRVTCPECGEGAEIDEEDAADLIACPKCGFEVYSCMMDKTAVSPALETRWQEFLKQHGGEKKPEPGALPYKREEPAAKRLFPASNVFWAMNTPSDRNEKSRLYENVLRDLGRKNDAYNEALNFFIQYKAKDKFPTQEEADAAARKLIQLSVKPNPSLVKMQDFVKVLLSKEPTSKMKALAEELNPGGADRRQKLSEAVQEAAKKVKEYKQ